MTELPLRPTIDEPSRLLMIVPSRGRPTSVLRMVQAWYETNAYSVASLVYVIDDDDPTAAAYYEQPLPDAILGVPWVRFISMPRWHPMVHKLNQAAAFSVGFSDWFSVGFMGDDHVPRSYDWAAKFVNELENMGTGIVYGNDLFQAENLPTHWAMTADIVHVLGRMVPAPVEHLYCDNAIADLGRRIGRLQYLPDVVVEHMHPLAGKGNVDDGYRWANSTHQYKRDQAAYEGWLATGLKDDAAVVAALG